MLKIVPFIALLTLIFTDCAVVSGQVETFTKLPPEGKVFAVKQFNAINVSEGVFNIFLRQCDSDGVLIKGDLPNHLTLLNDGETLLIKDTLSIRNTHKDKNETDIYISLKSVSSIEIDAVGKTLCLDTLKAKRVSFSSTGVGATTLWLHVDSIRISESGVGNIVLAGRSSYAEINATGVGNLDALGLKAGELHLNASGVGDVKVYAIKNIYLNSTGVGKVEYEGPARLIENNNTGIGRVKKIK